MISFRERAIVAFLTAFDAVMDFMTRAQEAQKELDAALKELTGGNDHDAKGKKEKR